MERKIGMTARVAIMGIALTACLAAWVALFAVRMAGPVSGPVLATLILAVVFASHGLAWGAALALTGSPRRLWRAMNGGM